MGNAARSAQLLPCYASSVKGAQGSSSSFFSCECLSALVPCHWEFLFMSYWEGGTNRGEEVPETPPIFSFLNRLAIQLSVAPPPLTG